MASKIVNQVVRERWGNCEIICVHKREVPSLADAAWILFCCENPQDPAVVARMRFDHRLREIVGEHVAKQKKPAQVCSEETAPT